MGKYPHPQPHLTTAVTERLACLLCSCFGSLWQSVFYRLGFTQAEIETVLEDTKSKSNHNNMDDVERHAICSLLIKWHQKLGKKATLGALMNQLELVHACGTTVIDWNKINFILENTLPM